MTDEFETYLGEALAPPSRDPDRRFVARVQARIALESRLEAQRRAIVRRLGIELIGLIAVAAGLGWLARAAPVADLAAESPWLALCVLLSIFALVVIALSAPDGPGVRLARMNR